MLENIRLTPEKLKEATDKYWADNTINRTFAGANKVSADTAIDKAIKTTWDWGEEECPHFVIDGSGVPVRDKKKHNCDTCWSTLRKLVKKEE